MKLIKIPFVLIILVATFVFCRTETGKADLKSAGAIVEKSDSQLSKRDELITFAKKHLGTPYRWASASPKHGFDCSGFVNYVFKHFGLQLPRSSSGFKNLGKALKPEEFKVGDVIVFYGHRDKHRVGHVGIVAEANGMKSKFIHASSGKEKAVTISDLASMGYTKRFYKCLDPFSL